MGTASVCPCTCTRCGSSSNRFATLPSTSMPSEPTCAEPEGKSTPCASFTLRPSRSCSIWMRPEATSVCRSETRPSYVLRSCCTSALRAASCVEVSSRFSWSLSRVARSSSTLAVSCSRSVPRSSTSEMSFTRSFERLSFDASSRRTRSWSASRSLTTCWCVPRVTQPDASNADARASSARRGRQDVVERFIDARNVLELEPFHEMRGDLLHVPPVPLRQYHALDARALRGEHLLLDAADRQHLAAERDLARHRNVGRGAPAREQRGEGCDHRHTCGRAVLRHGTLRHVHVQIDLAELVRRQTELARVALDPRARGLGRFAHHVAERAREAPLALARQSPGLDEQDVAARRRVRQADRDAGA